MTVFDQAFAVVVGHEGGFDVTETDPGNWTGGAVGKGALHGTKWGISAAAYSDLAISELSQADAAAIYRRDYWNRMCGDSLPPPLALLVFDAAVNNGVSRAIRWLQSAVAARPDGLMGLATIAAVDAVIGQSGMDNLCAEFLAQRLMFMASLPTWRVFGLGWARRLCQLPYQATAMGLNGSPDAR